MLLGLYVLCLARAREMLPGGPVVYKGGMGPIAIAGLARSADGGGEEALLYKRQKSRPSLHRLTVSHKRAISIYIYIPRAKVSVRCSLHRCDSTRHQASSSFIDNNFSIFRSRERDFFFLVPLDPWPSGSDIISM